MRDSDFDTEFATLRQARAIIMTARRQGLDSVKLAAAMGHEAGELGVTPPSPDYATVSILLGEVRDAGLPHEAIDRIYQAIDPDGYEEERYEQAVDLRDSVKLAAAMGHEAGELGVTPPSPDYATVSILLGEVRDAGLPHEAIDRIYQAIDPDGYEEERYEQAVDLREFGDEDADGTLDGLPRFDGEFSR